MGINKKGFTFIEIVVVIAVISLALPALFTIIFTILQQQTKIMHLIEVKREGDYAMNVIENLIRNYGVSIQAADNSPVCADQTLSDTSFDHFVDNLNKNTFSFSVDGSNRIASSSSIMTTVYLTNTNVSVSGWSMTCTRSNKYSPPLIKMQFNIQYATTSTRPEDTASLNYQTAVQMKSY